MASTASEVKETIGNPTEESVATPETIAEDGVVDSPDTLTDNAENSESPQSDRSESETGEQFEESVSTFTITIAGKKKKKKSGKASSSSDEGEDSQEENAVSFSFNIANTFSANIADIVVGASSPVPQSAPSVALTSSAAANEMAQYLISKEPSRDASAGVYTGSVITRHTEDGSPSPYTAYYTPDGKMQITGDFREGFKDALEIYKAADPTIQHLHVSCASLSAADGYAIIKMGVDADVMPVLTDRGILGSAQLLAEEGAKNNPEGSAADTQTYLEQVAGNPDLREKLIDEMVKAGLGEKEALKAMDDKALADKAFEHVMSLKPAAEAETVAELQPKETAKLDGGVRMDGNSVSLTNASNVNVSNVNVSTMINSKTGQETVLRHDPSSGAVTVNGHKMPGTFKDLDVSQSPEGLMVNGHDVKVSKEGLIVDGKKVEAEVKPEAKAPEPYRPAAKKPAGSGLTTAAAAAATAPMSQEETQAQQQQESKARSPGTIPNPFALPTLGRGTN